MAVIKAAKGGKTLNAIMNYVDKKAEITSGKDCPDDKEQAREQMQTTKEIHGQMDGRQYKHYVQSFQPGEVTPQQAHELGRDWAEKNFPSHEVFIATHNDKDHTHNHFVVNSVNYETGKKIHLDKKDLENFKSQSDEICKEHGLSTIDRNLAKEQGNVRAYDMNEYQTMLKGESWKVNAAKSLQNALEQSQGKGWESFKESMKAQGYQIEQKGKKHITLTDKDGHKVRADNLAKTFSNAGFSRDGIEKTINGPEMKQEKTQKMTPSEAPEQGAELPAMQGVKQIQNSVSNALGGGAKELGKHIQNVLEKGADATHPLHILQGLEGKNIDWEALTADQAQEKIKEIQKGKEDRLEYEFGR